MKIITLTFSRSEVYLFLAGMDGIHFCFVRGFGGVVFSVTPMNLVPNLVHPLANNFEDFLRLLLACGDSAALEQAWMWDKSQLQASGRCRVLHNVQH